MFQPITKAQQLPRSGSKTETVTVDFKAKPANTPFEMAKDAAAFANAVGGTLLIGAAEDAKGVVARYLPLSPEDAASAKRAYAEAVRDRCTPHPLFAPELIPHEGGVLLAVNVWPYPGQVVGVRIAADKAKEGHGGSAFVFPMRVGDQTVFLQPDQLAMLMLPEIRRTAILLDQLPQDLPVTILHVRHVEKGVDAQQLHFVECDLLGNHALFEDRLSGASDDRGRWPRWYIPLEAIEAVWSDETGWMVAVAGNIAPVDGKSRWVLHRGN